MPVYPQILEDAVSAAHCFEIPGRITSIKPYGNGHINQTFYFATDNKEEPHEYIVQKLNTNAFTMPLNVMHNIQMVTEHQHAIIAEQGKDPALESLTLVPAKDGTFFWNSADHGFWRCYLFVPHTVTYDFLPKDESSGKFAWEAARAIGDFQRQLSDLPAHRFLDSIPEFHDTPARVKQLHNAIQSNYNDRADGCERELKFVSDREGLGTALIQAVQEGRVPEAVIHMDPKINNIGFTIPELCGPGIVKAQCIFDLDTVGKGERVLDFGDFVRTTACPAAEDERDLSKVYVDLDRFRVITEGYLNSMASSLAPAEVGLLAYSARLLTYTIGIRFLADYLRGDNYFQVHREGQNLDRARVQLAMVRDMEQKQDQMEEIVAKAYDRLNQ